MVAGPIGTESSESQGPIVSKLKINHCNGRTYSLDDTFSWLRHNAAHFVKLKAISIIMRILARFSFCKDS